jgi:hypothetical protein
MPWESVSLPDGKGVGAKVMTIGTSRAPWGGIQAKYTPDGMASGLA